MKNTFLAIISIFIIMSISSCNTGNEEKSATAQQSDNSTYYFNTFLEGDYDTVIMKVTAALKAEGFGVVSTINMQEKIKDKLGKDIRKYVILGACSPQHAYQALMAEDKIGTMLPCNVIIQEVGENKYEVAAVNPIASMQAIKNPDLGIVAQEVTVSLKKVIESLND